MCSRTCVPFLNPNSQSYKGHGFQIPIHFSAADWYAYTQRLSRIQPVTFRRPNHPDNPPFLHGFHVVTAVLMRQFIWICHIPPRRHRETSPAGLNVFSRVSQWFHINWIPALSSSHVRRLHAFSSPFDLPFINRLYVNSSRGEQNVLAFYSAPTGCNGPSGSPASIQLNNQIVRRLWLRLIRLSKSSVHVVCVCWL